MSLFIPLFLNTNTRAYNDKGRKEGRNKVSERENRNKKKNNRFYFFSNRYFVSQNNESTLMERD